MNLTIKREFFIPEATRINDASAALFMLYATHTILVVTFIIKVLVCLMMWKLIERGALKYPDSY